MVLANGKVKLSINFLKGAKVKYLIYTKFDIKDVVEEFVSRILQLLRATCEDAFQFALKTSKTKGYG